MFLEKEEKKIVYIFIDESGDLSFNLKSSKNFYLGGLVVSDIDKNIFGELYEIKHKFLKEFYSKNKDFEYFHAAEDFQLVRNSVLDLIGKQKEENFRFYSIYTEKNKANPIFYENTNKYFFKHVIWLMNSIIKKENFDFYDEIVIFFDSMPTSKNKKNMFKGLKEEISDFFLSKNIKIPYYIFSHQSKSHIYLQIADYINWSINVLLERGEERPYKIISKFIKNTFNPFHFSDNKYY